MEGAAGRATPLYAGTGEAVATTGATVTVVRSESDGATTQPAQESKISAVKHHANGRTSQSLFKAFLFCLQF